MRSVDPKLRKLAEAKVGQSDFDRAAAIFDTSIPQKQEEPMMSIGTPASFEKIPEPTESPTSVIVKDTAPKQIEAEPKDELLEEARNYDPSKVKPEPSFLDKLKKVGIDFVKGMGNARLAQSEMGSAGSISRNQLSIPRIDDSMEGMRRQVLQNIISRRR